MIRPYPPLIVIGLAFACPPSGIAQTETPTTSAPREASGLSATQVTIAIEKARKRRQFRATVMARKEEDLTVLTAAHCLSDADENGPVLLLLGGGEVLEGTVLSVVRNPLYRAGQGQEIGGPDNAVARFRFKPGSRAATEAFEVLKPAHALSARSYPGPSGQTVSVRMVDGHGVEHVVRAGNYANPRWLEWGPAYKPIPGDSGGGVFVMHAGADGQARPILIGIIVGRDDRGGGASLVSREMRWLADELPR